MSSWLDLTKDQQLWAIRNDNSHIADTTDDIRCPWCGEAQNLDYDDVGWQDDQHEDRECNNDDCGKVFTIQTCVTTDWRTELPQDYLIEQAKKHVKEDTDSASN